MVSLLLRMITLSLPMNPLVIIHGSSVPVIKSAPLLLCCKAIADGQ